LGITRVECREFLQKQGNYTITSKKPLVDLFLLKLPTKENTHMDLCDMSNYSIKLLWGDNPIPILT